MTIIDEEKKALWEYSGKPLMDKFNYFFSQKYIYHCAYIDPDIYEKWTHLVPKIKTSASGRERKKNTLMMLNNMHNKQR